ncbi:MAG: GAF domain-containing protein [Aliishimia sp.]
MLKDGVALGLITLFRQEADPFSDREIALIKTFAAQAVIAIDNSRQFLDLQKQLNCEAATGEILGIISQSREADAAVFDKLLEQAVRTCGADQAVLVMVSPNGTHMSLAAN